MSDRDNWLTISADVFQASDDTWTAKLHLHPHRGGPGILIWQKNGMRTGPNAEAAMEAAYQRFQKAAQTGDVLYPTPSPTE